jgi:hypothetical protein
LFAAASLACRPEGNASVPDDSVPAGWAYEVSLADDARRADVRVCLHGSPSTTLMLPNRDGLPAIRGVRNVRTGKTLPRSRSGFSLAEATTDDCFEYGVSFFELARRQGMSRMVRWVGDSVMVRQSMWLLHPDEAAVEANIELSMTVPDGVEASVPWLETGRDGRTRRYRLDWTAFEWLGYTVFGTPRLQHFDSHGARVELATLDGPLDLRDVDLQRWIEDAIASSAEVYGRYPRDRLQVVVIPIEGRGAKTVYFGMAGRGGGPGVYLLLDGNAAPAELPGGWTTVHELLHHGMPFVEDAWMAEGWVSYYTELTRTRRGHRTEAEGWQALREAFERGRRTRRRGSLQDVSDRLHEAVAYQRVYWGGAAIAFFIDIELRVDSGGEVTLDDAMRELRRCCGDAPRKFTAQELLEHLDGWYGRPLFTTIADSQLGESGFPNVDRGFAALGVGLTQGGVVLDDAHPMAPARRDIMAPR